MQSTLIGKHVIVRTYSAGVHAGILAARDGKEVLLTNSRRIWSWKPATPESGSLSGVAVDGVGNGSKLGKVVPSIELTEAIEVIETTATSTASINAATWSGE